MGGVPLADLQALDVDLSACGETDVIALARHSRNLRGFLDSFDAGLSRHLKGLKAAGRSSGATPSEVLGRASGESSGERDKRERRADALDEAPEFDEALSDGEIVASHVDVFARYLQGLVGTVRDGFLGNRAELLESARHEDVGRFGRRCRDLIRRLERDAGITRAQQQRNDTQLSRTIDQVTGLYRLHGWFDPETGSRIFAYLDAEIATLIDAHHEEHAGLDRNQLAACALLNLTTRGNDSIPDDDGDHHVGGRGGNRPANVEMCVHVDLDSLRHGLHAHSICELESGVSIPVETARRLACDAENLPLVMGGDSIPLDHGRGRRQASRAQRRALRSMYSGCAFPGCDRRFDRCEMHHLVEWEHLGDTDIQNLLPLCSFHHHRVHEDGWRLRLASDRTLTVCRPDGSFHAIVALPSRNRSTTTPRSSVRVPPAGEREPTPGRPMPGCERPSGRPVGRRRSTPDQDVEQLRLT